MSTSRTVPETTVVTIEARLLPEEYETLRQASAEAGLSPNDFVRRAIVDEASILRAVGPQRAPYSVKPTHKGLLSGILNR